MYRNIHLTPYQASQRRAASSNIDCQCSSLAYLDQDGVSQVRETSVGGCDGVLLLSFSGEL